MPQAARITVALAALVIVGVALVATGVPPDHQPLWPGSRHMEAERARALQRGLHFLYDSFARNPVYFKEYGTDLLSAFDNIAETSEDRALSGMAWAMGHERALAWRRIHPAVPAKTDADEVGDLVFGTDTAEHLGVPDPRMREQLRQAVVHYPVQDYLWFDPVKEPPPVDLPRACPKCGLQNARGAAVCKRCGAKLEMRNRYDIYQDALIATYGGDRAGIPLGARYRDVLQWLPAMRPYPRLTPPPSDEYYSAVYAVTHLVYTYNGYSRFRISRACFPEEFEHLKANLRQAIADNDPETMGEYLDTLRAFGLTLDDPLIRTGFDFLLSAQNADGSWGDVTDKDPYGRYHPTWTAIDGLRDYRWTEVLPCP